MAVFEEVIIKTGQHNFPHSPPTIDWWWDLFNKYLERLIELEKKKEQYQFRVQTSSE